MVCKNKKLATSLMRREESEYTREKLKYEIKKILQAHPQEDESDQSEEDEIITIEETEAFISPIPFNRVEFEPIQKPKSNPLLDELSAKWKELYRQRGHLHGRLHQEDDKDKSFEIAKQIINIQPKIDQLKSDMEKLESGETPSGYLKNHLSGEQLVELRNTKQYIARYEKELKKLTDPEAIKRKQLLIDKYKMKLQNL